jgi:hypothetical protein
VVTDIGLSGSVAGSMRAICLLIMAMASVFVYPLLNVETIGL